MQQCFVMQADLENFVAGVLVRAGVSECRSRAGAKVLVFADRRGIHSHGVSNLDRIYLQRIRAGKIQPAAEPRVVADDKATTLIDAQGGLGIGIAPEAMQRAIDKGREFGAGVVAVRRSSHFGCAGYYAVQAQEAGMIGIAMSNLGGQAIARHPDGQIALCGTNPLSIAAPTGELPPFALDMSTTAVATGRIRSAMMRGEPVLPGWLVDDDGNTVTDPARYFDGSAHLQFLGGDGGSGGYKGFGLALAVDVLAGLLPGAQVGPDPSLAHHTDENGRAADDIGHVFVAIDISRFRELRDFQADMDRMLGTVLLSPSRMGRAPVAYPGYPEATKAERAPKDAVAVDGPDFVQLSGIAREFSVPLPRMVERPACEASMRAADATGSARAETSSPHPESAGTSPSDEWKGVAATTGRTAANSRSQQSA